ncbi:MAG: pyridoxamine 5'-phosphate oxidase family protein [Acidimicrobiia bacterium]|nr:pyridoxamine 5'-phosphate oxidase family protein [Acidimicrobiia bacterium]
MPRQDITITSEEIETFLSEGWNLQVATVGTDGWPHLTTLWYTIDNGLIVFRSFSRSQRIVNLRRDPRLTVLVETGAIYEELRGVMVRGRAELSNERAQVLKAYGAIAAKYQFGGNPLDPEVIEALFGGHADKNTVVTIHPEHTTSWDHRKLGGRY